MRVVRSSYLGKAIVATLSAALVALAVSSPAAAGPTAATAAAPNVVPAPRTWQVDVGQEGLRHAIQGMAFLPGTIWINQGDSIVWTARSGEIHTVTFLATGQPLTPFNPGDPNQLLPRGGTHYDGVSYYNSGVMTSMSDSGFPSSRSYSLTFDTTGNFTYYCLVHGMMMKGVVHVRAPGTAYPFSQRQYHRAAIHRYVVIMNDGMRLWRSTARHATNRKVFAGADDGVAMVMRFIGPTSSVRVGQSITFVNSGMAAPHTVTFGKEQANIFVPYGDPTHFTGQPLNSGIIAPAGKFKVTFTKKGTYRYFCALHDYMFMVGVVVVR